MNQGPVTKKALFISFVFSLVIVFFLFVSETNNRDTKIVFCDVGQGDAAYIRIKNKIDILVDAGPDKKILNCLGRHMPFWDRKIELAILSHPNFDHYGGFFDIIDRYHIDRFITIKTVMISKTYTKLVDKINAKEIPLLYKSSGNNVAFNNSRFSFLWPPINLKSYDDNDFSLVFIFDENGFRTLFTGDATPYVMNRLSDTPLAKINILKIPHHGSKNGLTESFLQLADPQVAVISVAKNNSYGHPSKEVLDILRAQNIKIKRTDKDGDVVFNLKESP